MVSSRAWDMNVAVPPFGEECLGVAGTRCTRHCGLGYSARRLGGRRFGTSSRVSDVDILSLAFI